MKRRQAWKNGIWIAAVALSLLTLAAAAPSGALADTCTVTTNADSGEGSLRSCIESASSGDTVVFDGDYTIALTTGQLTIDEELTIDGEKHAIAVDGNDTYRVFEIASGTTGTVTLRNLTVQNGNASSSHGGGIFNGATLSLENCTVDQNQAPSGYGGGVFNVNGATLSVSDSAISDNSCSGQGGAFTALARLPYRTARSPAIRPTGEGEFIILVHPARSRAAPCGTTRPTTVEAFMLIPIFPSKTPPSAAIRPPMKAAAYIF